MRILRMKFIIQIYKPEIAERKLKQQLDYIKEIFKDQQLDNNDGPVVPNLESDRVCVAVYVPSKPISLVELPALNVDEIDVFVSYSKSPSHFYIQYHNDLTTRVLKYLTEVIHRYYYQGSSHLRPCSSVKAGRLCNFRNYYKLKMIQILGQYVLAKREDDPIYFRARVESGTTQKITVFFIDNGESVVIESANLLSEINFTLTPDLGRIPSQAIQCSLSELKPAPWRSLYGVWDKEANDCFLNSVALKTRYKGNLQI